MMDLRNIYYDFLRNLKCHYCQRKLTCRPSKIIYKTLFFCDTNDFYHGCKNSHCAFLYDNSYKMLSKASFLLNRKYDNENKVIEFEYFVCQVKYNDAIGMKSLLCGLSNEVVRFHGEPNNYTQSKKEFFLEMNTEIPFENNMFNIDAIKKRVNKIRNLI